jgi:hypothetical protein
VTQRLKQYRHAGDAYSATFTEAVISSTSNGNHHQISIHRNHDGSTIDRVGFQTDMSAMAHKYQGTGYRKRFCNERLKGSQNGT